MARALRSDDGRALRLGTGKAATTDCPECCSPGGCCICVGPSPPCSPAQLDDCTVLECCCGSWFRVELACTIRATSPSRPGKFHQADITGFIETDCADPSHNDTHNTRHITGISNGGTPIDYTEESPPYGSNVGKLALAACKPAPREVYNACMSFLPNDGILNQAMKPIDKVWTAGNCSGNIKDGPATYQWTTDKADCSGIKITWSITRSDGGWDQTGTATFTVIRKDAKCCGDGGNPYNPAPPLLPTTRDPGQVNQCPRCGGLMLWNKCLTCGFCQGCGG